MKEAYNSAVQRIKASDELREKVMSSLAVPSTSRKHDLFKIILIPCASAAAVVLMVFGVINFLKPKTFSYPSIYTFCDEDFYVIGEIVKPRETISSENGDIHIISEIVRDDLSHN